jgi:hypothetical protein
MLVLFTKYAINFSDVYRPGCNAVVAVFSPQDEQYFSPKLWYLPTSPHGVTTQNTYIDTFTAMRNSNLIQY